MLFQGPQLMQETQLTPKLSQSISQHCSSLIDRRHKPKQGESFFSQQYFKKQIIKAQFFTKILHLRKLLKAFLCQPQWDPRSLKSHLLQIQSRAIQQRLQRRHIQAHLWISIIIFAKIRLMSIVSINYILNNLVISKTFKCSNSS